MMNHHRPWWVKVQEKPALGIDDAVYSRFDKRKALTTSMAQYIGEDRMAHLTQLQLENAKRRMVEGVPGYKLQDQALYAAAGVLHAVAGTPNVPNFGLKSWRHITSGNPGRREQTIAITTPRRLEADKYRGSPEAAAGLVKATARHFGAATVGITLMDRRHVFSFEADGKEIAFEPVEEPYEDEAKRVIPEACQFVVVMTLRMSRQTLKMAPSPTGAQTTAQSYSRLDYLLGATAEFIRGLGYVAIPSANDTASSIPFAIEAGLGELGRMNRLVTPQFGPMVRLGKIFTDLPLATDRPIDFGLRDFCRQCSKCAQACPPRAISLDPEPSFQVTGPWNNPGHEAWFENALKCRSYWMAGPGTNCGVCFAVCPFNKPQGLLHSMVKATISTTPLFDGFFLTMDDVFGYGKLEDPEKWWGLDLPEYGAEPWP